MSASFLNREKPLLTVMLQCDTPELAVPRIRGALDGGADAFGVQAEWLLPEFQTPDSYRTLFAAMKGKPCYTTYYRGGHNVGKPDDELADGMLTLADCGATLVDVMGDLFCRHPEELTDDAEATAKQTELIDRLHARGAEVLMSSHLYKFAPAERVLEIALEQKRRGADIIKIVTGADTMEQQIENLRTTDLLKRELGAPFLFLSVGECRLHRRLGITLGCCMSLCVYEHDARSTPEQPLLTTMQTLQTIDF